MQDDDVKKLIKTEGIDNIEQKDIIALNCLFATT
jgi:hypothetical protein